MERTGSIAILTIPTWRWPYPASSADSWQSSERSQSDERDAQAYAAPPYHRVWERREDDAEPYWLVRLAEIPEVVGDGVARPEAKAALEQCLLDYVRYRQDEGLPVPEPSSQAAAG